MKMEIHNRLDINYDKTICIVSYYAESSLEKFTKTDKWTLEVWLDENSMNSVISCGVSLKRPNKSNIYAKKFASNLNEAVKMSVEVIEKSIRREDCSWKMALSQQFAS